MTREKAIEKLRLHKKAIVEMRLREKQPEGQIEYLKIEEALTFAISVLERMTEEEEALKMIKEYDEFRLSTPCREKLNEVLQHLKGEE